MMDFLAAIGGALTTAGTGGLLGLVGSIASGWVKNSAAALELKREQMRFEQQISLARLQAENAAAQQDLSALTAAVVAEGKTNENVDRWVANVKSLWRPLLTLLLLLLAAGVFYAVLVGELLPERRADIIEATANSVLFLATLSVSFWFASRGQLPDRGVRQ